MHYWRRKRLNEIIYFNMLISYALSEENNGENILIFQDIYFKMLISDALSEEKKGEWMRKMQR